MSHPPSSNYLPHEYSHQQPFQHMDDAKREYNTYVKEKCMASFRLLHSHLIRLSNKDLAGTRSENGFKRAFCSLFGEDVDIFTNTMIDNVNQLENQLNKEELHENESTDAFSVLKKQFQLFIHRRLYSDDDSRIEGKYFLEYTRLDFQNFKDVLLQLMDSIEKLIAERIHHKREYNTRLNERKLQTQEGKINTVKVLDVCLVDTESGGTGVEQSDDSSRFGNDTDVDCAEVRPSYDSEPNIDKEQMIEEDIILTYDSETSLDKEQMVEEDIMPVIDTKEQMVEVQSIVDNVMPTNEIQQSEQPNFSNEGKVDQNVVQCLDKRSESESTPDNLITETPNKSLESENILLKKTIAQFHKDFSKLEAHCISLELELQNESQISGNNGQSFNELNKCLIH